MKPTCAIAVMCSMFACGGQPSVPAAEPSPPPGPSAETPQSAPGVLERTKVTDFKIEDNAVQLPGPVLFSGDPLVTTEESQAVLWTVIDFLEAKDYVTMLRIEVTEPSGTPSAQELSLKKSMAIARTLVGQGVDCRRLIPVGFGDTRPGREGSRFVIAELKGKALGGMPIDGGGQLAGDPCQK